MDLVLSLLDNNMFYNNYSISKYEMHMIRNAFGECGLYGSRF